MPDATPAGFLLSPRQRHLLSLGGGDSAFRAQCSVLVEGEWREDLLADALGRALARHEIFRTVFRRGGGTDSPFAQFVLEDARVCLERPDMSADEHAHEARVEEFLEAEWRRPFDLERGPVCRAALLPLAPRRALLVLTAPALVADARSLSNLCGELARLSADAQARDAADGADGPLQYADFAAWQAELHEGDEAAEGKEFWRQRPAPSRAGYDFLTRAEWTGARPFAPRALARPVEADTLARLEALAKSLPTTLEALLFASWQALLWRLSGRGEVTIGYVSEGRPYEELREAMGPYALALPVTCDLAADYEFGEALARAERGVAEALKWQEYFPFAGVEPEDACAPPAFAYEFAEWPTPDPARAVTFSPRRQRHYGEPFAAKLTAVRHADALATELHYDASAVSEGDARHLLERFHTLLADVARRPGARLGELEVLGAEERRQVLQDFGAPAPAPPAPRGLFHEQFARQAAETPEAEAAACGDESLSYAELEGRAERLARRLRAHGVGPEVVVGLCVERSLEMLVGVLAVLKAGGAYLPLDHKQPAERLAAILEEARPPVLLVQESLHDSLPSVWASVLYVEDEAEEAAAEVADDDGLRATPENLAYVIYTSGSTGGPKGVMVTHRALANYLHWCAQNYFGEAGAGSLVHSPLGFDLTVTSLLAPLCVGRRVTLLPDGADAAALAAALRGGVYALVKLTPAHLAALAQLLTPEEAARAARVFVIGGEALVWEALRFWREAAPESALVNEYGPTEATVGCCTYEAAGDAHAAGPVPIGRPIYHTRLYVLDVRGRPCPVGVPGELLIGGCGLARGYLNRPGLTAERFIPDPFSTEPGARLYKTGDVVRYLSDGDLEFLGRVDEQLKIRGYRVEPGEIEAALRRHGRVRDCVVVGLADPSGDRRLVAYVVARGGAAPSAAELRGHVEGLLPEYMVPSLFVPLEELPLTPNGKVDRARLPPPREARAAAEYVAPRTQAEDLVAGVWAQVLGVERVGVFDNFFDLGGHSLLAVQVLSRLRSLFQMELTVPLLFEAPTVARVVEALKEGEARPGQIEKVAATLKRLEAMSSEEVRALLADAG
jgi:amino acid adenylation domain-containing protein